MPCGSLAVSFCLLFTASASFAPIQWASPLGASLKLMPESFIGHHSRSYVLPQILTLGETSDSMVPWFTAKSDNTISVGGWCVEAYGKTDGDAVIVNSCNGGPTQRWNWVSEGNGRNMIQLQDTNLCLNVNNKVGSLNGATVHLQACGSESSASWLYEAPGSIPIEGASFGSDVRHLMIVLASMALFGVIGISAWLWRWRAKTFATRTSQYSIPLPAVQGGVSLIKPWRANQTLEEAATAVMAINATPASHCTTWGGPMSAVMAVCAMEDDKPGENFGGLKEGYYPGDLDSDPLGLKPEDPEALRELQDKKLNNGRRGMIAASGFMAQEAVTGTTWGARVPAVMIQRGWADPPAIPAFGDEPEDGLEGLEGYPGGALIPDGYPGGYGPDPEGNMFCYGLPGATPPLREWDPLRLSDGLTRMEVYRLREAELMHGRVAMMASAGFMVQERWHPLFTKLNGSAIKQIQNVPVSVWFAMMLFIGICESFRIRRGYVDPDTLPGPGYNPDIFELKDNYYPGDLGFDPLGLKPKAPVGLRKMQDKELNNGRLAMIAAIGFIAQEEATGKAWANVWS